MWLMPCRRSPETTVPREKLRHFEMSDKSILRLAPAPQRTRMQLITADPGSPGMAEDRGARIAQFVPVLHGGSLLGLRASRSCDVGDCCGQNQAGQKR